MIPASLPLRIAGVCAAILLSSCGSQAKSKSPSSTTTHPSVATTVPQGTTSTTSLTTTTTVSPTTTGSSTNSNTISRCRTSQLAASVDHPFGGATQHLVQRITLKNISQSTCSLFGYVGLQLDNASRHFMPTTVTRGSSYFNPNPGPTLIHLQPGSAATAIMTWSTTDQATTSNCPSSSYLEITPPNAYNYLFVPDAIAPCGPQGAIAVSALAPASNG